MNTYQRVCKFCGKPFIATNPCQQYCSEPHYETCVVCNKQFEVPKSMLGDRTRAKTCSKECKSELRKRTCLDKYGGPSPTSSKLIQQKIQETNLKRYGTKTPAENLEIQQKMKQTVLSRTGYEYVFQNPESINKAKVTNLKKYGVDSYTKTSEFEHKRRATCIQRYGVDNPAKLEETRRKMSETYKARTGYSCPFSNPDVQDKINQANFQKYNVKRAMQSEIGKEKYRQTSLSRYGTLNPVQSAEVQSKIRHTNMQKYGSECYLSSDAGKQKIQQSIQRRYKVSSISQAKDWKYRRMTNPEKIDNFMEFRQDCRKYFESHFKTKPTLQELAEELGISSTTAGQIVIQNGCQDCVNYVFSLMEHQVKSFIQSLDPNIKMICNTKQIIPPYEIDIYLPDYRIGIECNPTSTHNSSFSMFGLKDNAIDKKYHYNKSKMCIDKGVQLFHIFGYEWTHRRAIVESMIRNLLHKNNLKIYGRNTAVKLVSSSETRDFLAANHRQGSCPSSINLGLYTKDSELVSLMTFGKVRSTMGSSTNLHSVGEFELLRFCNKLNTNVIGGASKLFKYFCNNYSFTSIRSYSDIAHTSGNLYTVLGFDKVKENDPGYVWVDLKTDKAYHRINAQKRNIVKFLGDSSIDMNHTEQQIMEDHGFVWVYDSGTILWRYMNR